MTHVLRLMALGAEPADAPPFDFNEQIRELTGASNVEVIPIPQVRFLDVADRIAQWRPHIIQFTGHGTRGGNLVFVDDGGEIEIVPRVAARKLFSVGLVRRWVRGIVLNSCYSEPLAKELVQYFDFVTGTRSAIGIEAARRFSTAFYRAIDRADSLSNAFQVAEANFIAKQTSSVPSLLCADGIDPDGYPLMPPHKEKPLLFIHHHPEEADFLEELRTNLAPLERRGPLEVWDRTEISIGQKISASITAKLEQADIILLMVSPKALSDDRWERHMRRAMIRHEAGTAIVLPLSVRQTLFFEEEFGNVAFLEPDADKTPLAAMSSAQRQKAWVTVCQRIAKRVAEIKQAQQKLSSDEGEIHQRLEEVLQATGSIAAAARDADSARQYGIKTDKSTLDLDSSVSQRPTGGSPDGLSNPTPRQESAGGVSTHKRLKQVTDALLSGYPDMGRLEQLCLFGLGKSLNQLVPPRAGDYTQVIVALVTRANAEAWLDDLVSAAKDDNPRNPLLKAL